MPYLDPVQARAFLAVYEAGSIARAARDLFLSQPALSRRIADLERLTGTALFVRSARGVTPTPAADRLAPRAQELVHRAAAAVQSLDDDTPVRVGIVGGEQALPGALLVDVVTTARRVRPRCEILYSSVGLNEQVQALVDRRVDVVVTVPALPDPRLVCVPLFTDRLVLVTPDGVLPLAEWTHLDQVARLPLLVNPRADPTWMAPYTLTDLRPLTAIEAVPSIAHDLYGAFADLRTHRLSLITSERVHGLLGPIGGFEVRPVVDAEPVTSVAAVLANPPPRAAVHDVVAALRLAVEERRAELLPLCGPAPASNG